MAHVPYLLPLDHRAIEREFIPRNRTCGTLESGLPDTLFPVVKDLHPLLIRWKGIAVTDTTIKKVNASTSPFGEMNQKYLVSGTSMAMRLWEEGPSPPTARPTRRDYETIGYVIEGRAELELEGQKIFLEPGDSWLVPKDAVHRYRILEHFVAVESTSPPARIHNRDAI